ncbi:permease [Enterococcus sp. DIV0242_7C1]|uniref:Permease n=1 Tax=Candidatus Enterococcus dunnyi TaxID=1834192 RepID=A0A200J902_9ENTE|nr:MULTISPECIES: permease [unclassified Enterococcus]MBO0471408.1 permease [Enterococcus sp. DIV0242_7C1]MCA5013435.1 permease [Enterococcus sp. S23]MCA5016685.1 permease [Enterococcus sp. S22(2020)]OUZ33658.1 permease [Enterococcus sp. 9D6_DIV0238]
MFEFLPHSVLQMGTIFLSIVIEALPFVMLGCVISGALHVFLTPERVKKLLPKNKILSILVGSFLGFFFPSCECGIVPIVHQFVKKEVPTYTAFAFMITAPIINPIVLFSTYIAFGNSMKFVLWRVLGSMLVALVIGFWLAYVNKESILKQEISSFSCEHGEEEETENIKFLNKCWSVLTHGIDEFFDTGRYLIFGSLLAAAMQTYLPTGAILQLGHTKILAILVMLVLAATLSLCSEADAFIGSSLLSLFGNGPIVGFLVFGPMVDIKNLLMMKRYFKTSFMMKFVGIVTVVVTIYALAIPG